MKLFPAALRLVTLLIGSVCIQLAYAGANPKIAVSTTPLSLPFYVAQELNLFRQQGINPEIIECVGGVKCLKLALEGEADYATCSELPIVYSSFNRRDFSVLATFVSNSEDMKLLVRSELMRNNFPQSLAGRKVGVVSRSASQYYLNLVLLLHGMAPSEVELVPLKPAEMQNAMSKGQIDAVSIWEPFAYAIQNAMGSAVQPVDDLSIFTQTFNLVGRNDSVRGDLEQNIALLKALQKASEIIQTQPEKAKRILQRRLNLTEEFVTHNFPGHSYQLSLKQSLFASMLNQREWIEQLDYMQATEAGGSILELLWVEPLQAVLPGQVDLPARLSP